MAMKHAGKAMRAALRLLYWTLFFSIALPLLGVLVRDLGELLMAFSLGLFGLWAVFGLFCLYFFRDPNPVVPPAPELIVSPAHGTVDVIEETEGPDFMGGRCRRISIFLSVFDVHVQRSPLAGTVRLCQHTSGQFLNAMRTDSATFNENVLFSFDSSERPGEKIGVRLIAGLIARRIVPWTKPGDQVGRGERISLIQFGSRVDLYLPLNTRVNVQLRDRVKGGETIMATRV